MNVLGFLRFLQYRDHKKEEKNYKIHNLQVFFLLFQLVCTCKKICNTEEMYKTDKIQKKKLHIF